jgi:hypothetical protein
LTGEDVRFTGFRHRLFSSIFAQEKGGDPATAGQRH